MKLKISESKIRQIVNEEVLKGALTKTLKEQKWPTYTAHLGAEILKLEWSQKLQENKNLDKQPSPEWIAETASAFGLSEAEIAEATEIMNNEELDEGVGGFLKAIAKPYQNIWQTFTNITQHAANLTDPDAQAAAKPIAQAAQKMPEPEEIQQAAKESPEDLQALIRQLIDLLNKTDEASDSDEIQPGMEKKLDAPMDALEKGAEAGLEDLAAAGGAEGGEEAAAGPTVSVFKGKGGKGLQSFLDRSKSGVSGKVYGAILKHVAKNLKSQGVTVTESVIDDVQGWVWYGLVESAYRAKYGQTALLAELRAAEPESLEQAMAGGAGDAGGGKEPVIQIWKGKKGVGLQSWMDMNRDKLGLDQTDVKLLLMTVEDWAKANKLRVENISHDKLNKVIPEAVNRIRAHRLLETINKLKNV